MPIRRSLVLACVAQAALAWAAPAHAFDDHDFCVAIRQVAVAADADVGVWIDRQTRNAGMIVACDTKKIEFRRFTYAPSSSMNQAWKQEKSAEWNRAHCGSSLWTQAIRNAWTVTLSLTAADGGHVALNAECK